MRPTRSATSTAAAAGLAASVLAGCAALPLVRDTPPRQPDIILIFVDDLGYADLSVQGSEDIFTPNIDRIAANGVRFTSGYVTAPQCSPSRAGIMTGRYNQRFGHEANAEAAMQDRAGLATDQRTLGDAMQALGYRTATIGEWDLGRIPSAHPLNRGFDEFYGFYGASRPFLPGSTNPAHLLHDGHEVSPIETSGEDYYLTIHLTDKALDFMGRHRDEPHFLYLAYHAPHWPLQALPADYDRNAHIQEENRRRFAAIMTTLDDSVGRILDYLEAEGRADNTLLFFISDNGGPTGVVEPDGTLAFGQTTSRNDPLRGVKGQLYEGGIRVPFLAQWPGTIPAGVVEDTPVITIDILPTIASAAGPGLPDWIPTDGVDILPLMRGDSTLDPRRLYFRWMGQKAVREGRWKFVQMADRPAELYDIEADIAESRDLSASEPEVLARLQRAWFDWNEDNRKPMWRRPEQIEMMRRNYVNGFEMHPAHAE